MLENKVYNDFRERNLLLHDSGSCQGDPRVPTFQGLVKIVLPWRQIGFSAFIICSAESSLSGLDHKHLVKKRSA